MFLDSAFPPLWGLVHVGDQEVPLEASVCLLVGWMLGEHWTESEKRRW